MLIAPTVKWTSLKPSRRSIAAAAFMLSVHVLSGASRKLRCADPFSSPMSFPLRYGCPAARTRFSSSIRSATALAFADRVFAPPVPSATVPACSPESIPASRLPPSSAAVLPASSPLINPFPAFHAALVMPSPSSLSFVPARLSPIAPLSKTFRTCFAYSSALTPLFFPFWALYSRIIRCVRLSPK